MIFAIWWKKELRSLALNKFDAALSYFDRVLEIDSHNFAALNNKCLSFNGLGKFNDAIDGFDQILYEDSQFYFSLIGKGESLYFLEYYDSAIDYFNRALEINPNNDSALYGKSKALNKLEQYNDVLSCFDKIKRLPGKFWIDERLYKRVSRNSNNAKFNKRKAFVDKINSFIADERYYEVLDILDEALQFDQKSTVFLCNKGYSLYKLGNYEEALTYIDRILEIDFMNVDALKIKSKIYIKLNQYEDALICLDDIKKFGGMVDDLVYEDVVDKIGNLDDISRKISSFIQEGKDYLSNEDYDSALYSYEQVLKLDSNNVIALNNKGFVLYILDKYDLAVQVFNQALSIDEEYVYSLLGKSYALYFLDDFDNSLKCYDKIRMLDRELFDKDYFELLNMKIKKLWGRRV